MSGFQIELIKNALFVDYDSHAWCMCCGPGGAGNRIVEFDTQTGDTHPKICLPCLTAIVEELKENGHWDLED